METQTAPAQTAVANPAPTQPSQAQSGVKYAGFGKRLLAVIVDTVILLAVMFALSFVALLILGSDPETQNMLQIPLNLFGLGYYVYFTYKDGATLGKKVMKIKVVREDGQKLTVLGAILREVVGKMISAMVLLLGYFWVLWDPKKQAWHDKIAKTVVIEA